MAQQPLVQGITESSFWQLRAQHARAKERLAANSEFIHGLMAPPLWPPPGRTGRDNSSGGAPEAVFITTNAAGSAVAMGHDDRSSYGNILKKTI